MARITAPALALLQRVEAARGRLFVWVPVFLAIGIGIYFQLPREPGFAAFAGLGLAALGLAIAGQRLGGGAGPVLMALALVLAGVVLAGGRSARVAAPVLEFRYYGPVEGRIIGIDRSASDAVRLTLDRVRLDRVDPARVPEKVRVSLHGEQGFVTPAPGMVVATTAFLTGPGGPVEPGGFDFQRMAWFRQIGAVGYTRVPVLEMAPVSDDPGGLLVTRLRARISDWVRQNMPGEAGAFAAAVTTGDRSAMGQSTLAALRASNLAHLLAISGLHMGLLTGFVFAFLRYAMALVPGLALRLPVKKQAALAALAAGGFYLALSGGNVATQRAFIMVAAMFLAVLFDRRALTLRSVAAAALFVLILRPEALTQPGFQMSFAATTALVAIFNALQGWRGWRAPKWLRPALAVLISSLVAGLATAPFSAAAFNQISHYGVLANLLAVPVMGAVVMPGAVLAAVLAPLGLSWLALAAMRPAIEWILFVAQKVSGLDGAVSHVPSPGPWVLPLVALGGVMLVLLRGRARLAGPVLIMVALGLWGQARRPDLLISPSGGLVGLMSEAGRVLNKPRGEGFAAGNWLENDGDPADQAEAYARGGFRGDKGWLRFSLGREQVALLSGRGAAGRVGAACAEGASVVILAGVLAGVADAVEEDASGRGSGRESGPGSGRGSGPCRVIDRAMLARTGALAVRVGPEGWQITEARKAAGARPWNAPGRGAGRSQ